MLVRAGFIGEYALEMDIKDVQIKDINRELAFKNFEIPTTLDINVSMCTVLHHLYE